MNRLYVTESSPTITAMADHRVPLPRASEEVELAAVAAALGVGGGAAAAPASMSGSELICAGEDLQANRGPASRWGAAAAGRMRSPTR